MCLLLVGSAFLCFRGSGHAIGQRAAAGQVQDENLWAGRCMDYAMELVKNRVQRNSWLWFGFPGSLVGLLHQDLSVRTKTLDKFLQAYEAWAWASSLPNPGMFLKAVLARSPFAAPLVINLARIAYTKGLCAELLDSARAAIGLTQTKLVEDANHFLRNMESRAQCNSTATNARAWHEIVVKRVLSEAPRSCASFRITLL